MLADLKALTAVNMLATTSELQDGDALAHLARLIETAAGEALNTARALHSLARVAGLNAELAEMRTRVDWIKRQLGDHPAEREHAFKDGAPDPAA
jgi:regulator of sirC expression with transglutaminase-like and TPR domain